MGGVKKTLEMSTVVRSGTEKVHSSRAPICNRARPDRLFLRAFLLLSFSQTRFLSVFIPTSAVKDPFPAREEAVPFKGVHAGSLAAAGLWRRSATPRPLPRSGQQPHAGKFNRLQISPPYLENSPTNSSLPAQSFPLEKAPLMRGESWNRPASHRKCVWRDFRRLAGSRRPSSCGWWNFTGGMLSFPLPVHSSLPGMSFMSLHLCTIGYCNPTPTGL